VVRLIGERGWRVGNVDCTLVMERPKIMPHIPAMRSSDRGPMLGVEEDAVGIKATTNEKLGYVGREEGVCAYAVALIVRRANRRRRPPGDLGERAQALLVLEVEHAQLGGVAQQVDLPDLHAAHLHAQTCMEIGVQRLTVARGRSGRYARRSTCFMASCRVSQRCSNA
jgi:hypothetical protein